MPFAILEQKIAILKQEKYNLKQDKHDKVWYNINTIDI